MDRSSATPARFAGDRSLSVGARSLFVGDQSVFVAGVALSQERLRRFQEPPASLPGRDRMDWTRCGTGWTGRDADVDGPDTMRMWMRRPAVADAASA
jgi:hypothetical protein